MSTLEPSEAGMSVKAFGTWSFKDNYYVCSKCSGIVIFDWLNEDLLRCTKCDTSMAPYGMNWFKTKTDAALETFKRAKIVARILTDNGQPVTPPDEASLDDVELERWHVCIEIVKALDKT